MKKLENLSLTDVKTSLDFARELKADAIKDSKLITNEATVDGLTRLEEKLRSHMFYRVNALRYYE
ncbi:hypothetical protein HYN59_13065 [Flavobacterium album]|uniref:Uncharacterized protein n=1 Tax=Flavobacterium album TaxID=2175091 RepID=A0A2S1QZZ6_9FLAO|nr:hypothetical protein [Flavobacterium album]AWH85980.1 hypothetical protein HYN59_13065 [Flavobacterium album]